LKIAQIFRDIFGGKDTVYMTQKLESEKYKLAIEDFAIQMAINIIAGAVSKCEFKTYSKGKEIKGDEYYLWNVEPNDNQNSSEFIQEFISKLLYRNECLIVNVSGKFIIADDFTQNEYALYPNTFTSVSRGTLTFDRTFNMDDVLYFKYGNRDIRALLSNLISGYSDLLDMAIGKYKRSGGRKGVAKIGKTFSARKDYQQQIDDLFNTRFKSYFNNENAVVPLLEGIDYTEISGEGSKKSTSEITDIANITKEAMTRVAQAFRIPPALLQGDIADVEKITDNFLTFCIDTLTDMIQTEINRKRYGKAAFLDGSFLCIDTTCIKHIDIFSIADKADKLISDGMYSIDELREKLRDMPLNTWWSVRHWMTKNYSDIAAIDQPQDQPMKGVKRTLNEILKAATVAKLDTDENELALINQNSMKELTADDVFTFKIVVCGNEIDRDFEVFPEKSLQELAVLLNGKTVMQDHNPKAENQKARIYKTEVVKGNGTTKAGEPYSQLIAHCYMANTESNKDFIAEIEAGIKKEVSVGCAVKSVICSICGVDNRVTVCDHYNGLEYGGQTCYKKLVNPVDAYEVSFVAVPSQTDAGVTKSYGGEPPKPKEPTQKTVADMFRAAFKTEESK
jgi:HK97 family phage portal protein